MLFTNICYATTQKINITAYTKYESGGDISAKGNKLRPGHIAISQDLLKKGWTFGKKVHIKDVGIFIIEDTMPKKWKNKLDIYMLCPKKAKEFGLQTKNVKLLN
jgi:3D (Asp-Asp-Asp) domain-containing protein